jgi:hypothetical protein
MGRKSLGKSPGGRAIKKATGRPVAKSQSSELLKGASRITLVCYSDAAFAIATEQAGPKSRTF